MCGVLPAGCPAGAARAAQALLAMAGCGGKGTWGSGHPEHFSVLLCRALEYRLRTFLANFFKVRDGNSVLQVLVTPVLKEEHNKGARHEAV